ncbi:MAG TPA: hypothetical protein VFG19_01855, partial [Geobacteraceae bacterium]|nr:hypothetical protein [Geobacteraceae bacterium]
RKQNAALGQQAITAIEVIKKVAEGNIRITPDILVAGDKGGLLDVLLAQLVKKETKAGLEGGQAASGPVSGEGPGRMS